MSHPDTHSAAKQHRHQSVGATVPDTEQTKPQPGKALISRQRSNESTRPEVIVEISEPSSPETVFSAHQSPPASILSGMLRDSTSTESNNQDDESSVDGVGTQPAIVGQGIISQPSESTRLTLERSACRSERNRSYGAIKDLESQKTTRGNPISNVRRCFAQTRENSARVGRLLTNPKSWDGRNLWIHAIREPASYIPPVILGLLLNILDALSYGEECLAGLEEIKLLKWFRDDTFSTGSANICGAWSGRYFNVLRQLHSLATSLLLRW